MNYRRSLREAQPLVVIENDYQPAMEFSEIGKAMGVSTSGARWIFEHAMRKLRQDPAALERLAELVAFRQSLRGPSPTRCFIRPSHFYSESEVSHE